MKQMLLSLFAVSFLMVGCNVEINKDKPKQGKEEAGKPASGEETSKKGEE